MRRLLLGLATVLLTLALLVGGALILAGKEKPEEPLAPIPATTESIQTVPPNHPAAAGSDPAGDGAVPSPLCNTVFVFC